MEIKFTPDYKADEPVFWRVFKELAKNNNGLVSYYNLQERLISTGKLDAGESVLMIEHMEKSGNIEKTGDYNIYRIGKSVTTTGDVHAVIPFLLSYTIRYDRSTLLRSGLMDVNIIYYHQDLIIKYINM